MYEWTVDRMDEGFEELTAIMNGYGKLASGEHLYGGYIYDMVNQYNQQYINVYLDGGFIQASGDSPFTRIIEKQQWYCFAIIDPYGVKGTPFLHPVETGFMFRFKEIDTKLWQKRQEVRELRADVIRATTAKDSSIKRINELEKKIFALDHEIDEYMKLNGEV